VAVLWLTHQYTTIFAPCWLLDSMLDEGLIGWLMLEMFLFCQQRMMTAPVSTREETEVHGLYSRRHKLELAALSALGENRVLVSDVASSVSHIIRILQWLCKVSICGN